MSTSVPLLRNEFGAEVVSLWPDQPVSSEGGAFASLDVYLPETPAVTRSSVIVCPGGGYGFLACDHEGVQIARWLNGLGIAAFVLHYRHAPHFQHPAPLHDAQRAMRIVRLRAEEWGVNPGCIGVMGFSAGGHLAASLATHYDRGDDVAEEPIARMSSRPDFAILTYPVITTYPPYAHIGSRDNLLGENADPALVELMANERQVTPDTPPTFLFHTDTDDCVHPMNSILFYTALKQAGVPAELHIYAQGPHGVGLCQDNPILGTWPARLADWFRVREIV